MINIKEFHSSQLKIDKKSYKNIGIYYIGYITIKSISDYENINSVNPLYLIIAEVDGYIEENNGNKYLTFASTGKSGEYEKYYMKIKFNSDDNLPLNKMLKLHLLTVIVRSIFEKDRKYDPQVFLDE